MEMVVELYHVYEGPWTEREKKLVEKTMIAYRSYLVGITNPLIETFNSEWDNLHPEVNGMEDGTPIMDEYYKFMTDKMNDATRNERLAIMALTGLLFRYDPEEKTDISAINMRGGKVYIEFKPVEEI